MRARGTCNQQTLTDLKLGTRPFSPHLNFLICEMGIMITITNNISSDPERLNKITYRKYPVSPELL